MRNDNQYVLLGFFSISHLAFAPREEHTTAPLVLSLERQRRRRAGFGGEKDLSLALAQDGDSIRKARIPGSQHRPNKITHGEALFP